MDWIIYLGFKFRYIGEEYILNVAIKNEIRSHWSETNLLKMDNYELIYENSKLKMLLSKFTWVE